MKNNRKIRVLLSSCVIFFAAGHNSFAEEVKVGDYTKADAIAISTLATYARSNRDWERVSSTLGTLFDSKDPGGDGFRSNERDIAALQRQTRSRVSSMSKWLKLDLDGDGSVTEQELRDLSNRPFNTQRIGSIRKMPTIKPTKEQAEIVYQAIVEGAELPDINGDGTVTIDEMLQRSRELANENALKYGSRRSTFQISFSYDTDKDGAVSKDEYLAAIRNIFVKFDTNKNNKLERDETRKLRDIYILTRTLLKSK